MFRYYALSFGANDYLRLLFLNTKGNRKKCPTPEALCTLFCFIFFGGFNMRFGYTSAPFSLLKNLFEYSNPKQACLPHFSDKVLYSSADDCYYECPVSLLKTLFEYSNPKQACLPHFSDKRTIVVHKFFERVFVQTNSCPCVLRVFVRGQTLNIIVKGVHKPPYIT